MTRQACSLGVQVLRLGHPVWFQHTSMDEQELVACRRKVLDDGSADESSSAEDDYFQAGLTDIGLRSTIRSIKPQSLASSGFMKKSRSIALSTSSSGRPVCLA